MSISLTKGGNVNLSKESPNMTQSIVGLGWDARATNGKDFDLDVSVFLVGDNNKVLSDQHFIYFNNLKSPDGSIQHQGDNRTGIGQGDDEQIKVALNTVSLDIKKVIFSVTIYEAEERKQNFGMVSNAYIRIINEENKSEIARYDLSEDASIETAMVFGELYRHNGEWKFKAVGQGFVGGLAALASQHGVNLR